MTAPLDLGKPMQTVSTQTPVTTIYHDDTGALVEFPNGERFWRTRAALLAFFENIPPEPPEPKIRRVWVNKYEEHAVGNAYKSRHAALSDIAPDEEIGPDDEIAVPFVEVAPLVAAVKAMDSYYIDSKHCVPLADVVKLIEGSGA